MKDRVDLVRYPTIIIGNIMKYEWRNKYVKSVFQNTASVRV